MLTQRFLTRHRVNPSARRAKVVAELQLVRGVVDIRNRRSVVGCATALTHNRVRRMLCTHARAVGVVSGVFAFHIQKVQHGS